MMPDWVIKLARRILALNEGCWQIVCFKECGCRWWTVMRLGKIERP